MRKRVLSVSIPVAVLAVFAACGSGGDRDDGPRLLVAVAGSFAQTGGEPTPIQVFEYPSGNSQTGPSASWVNLALSPLGDRLAVAEFMLGDDANPYTLSLFDTADLTLSQSITGTPLPATIDWSPSGEFVLVAGIQKVAVYDVDAETPLVREVSLERSGSAAKRRQVAWPSSGEWLLMFVDGKTLVGVSESGQALRRWTFECPETSVRGLISLEGSANGESVEVLIDCRGSEIGYFSTNVSTLDGTVGAMAFRELVAEGPSFPEVEALQDEYPGAAVRYHDNGGADTGLGSLSVLYSPTVDTAGYLWEEGSLPPDVEGIVAVKVPVGDVVYVPLELAGEPSNWIDSNLLYDVVEGE